MRIKAELAIFIPLLSAISATSSNHHIITGSQQQFVIVDSDSPQLYRLLGVLPLLNTWKTQIVFTLALAVIVGLPLLLYFLFRPKHPYADWTSRLPDSLINILFYIQYELAAIRNILLGEMMALMHSPLGIGFDMATNLSLWSPLGRSGTSDERGEKRVSKLRTGRAALRRKQHHATNGNSIVSGSNSTSNGTPASYFPGLYNTGNSCFLNSTLQSLASLDVLKEYLDNVMHLAEAWDVPTPVTDALYDLVNDLNAPGIKRSALIPRQVTEALSNLPQTKVGSFFYAHQQQDAHEVLVLLTSAIDDEMNMVLAERDYIQRRQAVGLRAVVAPSLPSLYSCASSFASSSTNPFRSLVAQRTACLDCGYVEAVRHYPADELSLGVPFRLGSATTLEMCLRNWSKLEKVDWICFRCSLQKTLEKVRSDVNRLMSGSINGHSTLEENVKTNESAPSKNFDNKSNSNEQKMTNSKKKKLREAKRKETVLISILEGNFSEDEVESARLLEKASIKLERSFSSLSTKQVMIARTPKVLVLHLNRSNYSASNFGASKNNTPVLFDEYLDISDVVTDGELNISGNLPISRGSSPARDANGKVWMDRTTDSDGYLNSQPLSRVLYRLCAIVVHYGSHSAGHYVSFRRRRIKRRPTTLNPIDDVDQVNEKEYDAWFRISDDNVSSCSSRDVLGQNPFILFYQRVEDVVFQGHRQGRSILERNGNTIPNGNGSDMALMPKGFEVFARNEMQQKRATFHPRVVERWNTVH